MKPEEAFQRQVIELAKMHGWRVAHFRAVRVQRKDGSVHYATPVQADGEGFPDLILVRGPVMLAWELKVPPNKPTPAQIGWIVAFKKVGADARVMTPAEWPEIEKVLMART